MAIEGYCSKQSVAAGEKLQIMVSTQPAAKFQIEIFRTGYYGGRGARLMTRLGPFEGQAAAACPSPTSGPCTSAAGNRAAELTIPADWPSGVYLGRLTTLPAKRRPALLAKLRGLHRSRRPPGRRSLPVQRQHVAGLQRLALQVVRLHAPQGQPGPLGRRELRSALRPRGPVLGNRQRSALGRLRRMA